MIGDVALRVGGPHATVETLMGPGVDPHLFKPSAGDLRRLESADLILHNGLHLEGKMGDIFDGMARRGRSVVAVAAEVPKDRLRHPPELQGNPDPHVWFDVGLWAMTARPIVRALAALDPAHAADFDRNAAAVETELRALDLEVEKRIAEIPEAQRILVTAHDAFGYFGKRYRIEVMGLQGISTVAEAGIRDVERLTDLIVSRKVKAIFVETSVSPRAIDAVRKACESRGHAVAVGGQLFSDAMGPAGTPEGTYPGMVRHNVKTIVEALR
jgi:manganese/zinc/iron transport system substrate-binding protein